MNAAQRRASRLHQAKHRGSALSYKTELENLQLLLCWESEQLSEGQMARLLDIDRVSLRKMRTDAIDSGMKLAEQLDTATRTMTTSLCSKAGDAVARREALPTQRDSQINKD